MRWPVGGRMPLENVRCPRLNAAVALPERAQAYGMRGLTNNRQPPTPLTVGQENVS